MPDENQELADLRRKVQYLTDRQEILDCVIRTARGNDRHDEEWIVSAYHPDAIHEVASNKISGPDYGEHANKAHTAICDASLHNVTMQACEIEGDTAHSESYALGIFLEKGAKKSRILAGRYIDRLERRDGKWKIVVRRATVEIIMEGDAGLLNTKFFRARGYLKGSRDRTDLTYLRPLGLEEDDRWEVESDTSDRAGWAGTAAG